jgi:hypothetical protein
MSKNDKDKMKKTHTRRHEKGAGLVEAATLQLYRHACEGWGRTRGYTSEAQVTRAQRGVFDLVIFLDDTTTDASATRQRQIEPNGPCAAQTYIISLAPRFLIPLGHGSHTIHITNTHYPLLKTHTVHIHVL